MSVIAYPSAIARACSSIDESPVFSELPDGYIRVLVRIIKKINLSKLKAPIYASRSTLAEESGKSIETVGRVVKWLEDRGLIVRNQKARAGLKGSSSPLVPTDKLLNSLLLRSKKEFGCLPEEVNEGSLPPQSASAAYVAGVTVNDCSAIQCNQNGSLLSSDPEVVLTESSLSESSTLKNVGTQLYPQDTTESSVSTDVSKSTKHKQPKGIQPQHGNFTPVDGYSLPTDLVWLVKEQGVRPTAILLLMKLAKNVGQRLSDIVYVSRKYLLALRGKHLFSYLRALVMKDRDYGFLLKEETRSFHESLERKRIAEKAEALCGRTFSSRNGDIFVTVEKNGILTEFRNGCRACRPLDNAFLTALENGRLKPC